MHPRSTVSFREWSRQQAAWRGAAGLLAGAALLFAILAH